MFRQFSNKDSMKHLLGLQLWHLFKHAEELNEVVRKNDKLFIDCLIKFELVTLMVTLKN